MEVNHGNPVEDVIFLPSGGLIATAGGNCVELWDLLSGGKLLFSMENHNKTVTSICVGRIGKDTEEESKQFRILSVGLDGWMKVFDYAAESYTFYEVPCTSFVNSVVTDSPDYPGDRIIERHYICREEEDKGRGK